MQFLSEAAAMVFKNFTDLIYCLMEKALNRILGMANFSTTQDNQNPFSL